MLRHIVAQKCNDFITTYKLFVATQLILKYSNQYGYADDSKITQYVLTSFINDIKAGAGLDAIHSSKIKACFDPTDGRNIMHTQEGEYAVSVITGAAFEQPELFEKVVDTAFGTTLVNTAVKVIIGPSTTTFYDREDVPLAKFFAAGRMGGDTDLLPVNAQTALKLLAIEFDVDKIAREDFSAKNYRPLIFKKVDGAWQYYERASVLD